MAHSSGRNALSNIEAHTMLSPDGGKFHFHCERSRNGSEP